MSYPIPDCEEHEYKIFLKLIQGLRIVFGTFTHARIIYKIVFLQIKIKNVTETGNGKKIVIELI